MARDPHARSALRVRVCWLTACCLCLLAYAAAAPPAQSASRMNGQALYAVGDEVTELDWWTTADRTLLFFFRPSCPYCARSMPFYRDLGERIASSGGRDSQLIAVATTDVDEARAYLSSKGVQVAKVLPAGRAYDRIDGVPTLIVVDADKKILKVWTGMLRPAEEREVRRVARVD